MFKHFNVFPEPLPRSGRNSQLHVSIFSRLQNVFKLTVVRLGFDMGCVIFLGVNTTD